MQPTWPQCGQGEQEGKGREVIQEEMQKEVEKRKVTQEGKSGARQPARTPSTPEASGPGFATVLAPAISMNDSWLGAGLYLRAACPPGTPLPWAGSHPSPARSTGCIIQAGAGDLEGQHTLESSHREMVSVLR